MFRLFRIAGSLLATTALIISLAPAASASSSVQIVLSAQIPSSTTTGNLGPTGFWIWCEGASTNPYKGQCSGSMYFYDLGLVKAVFDSAPPVVTSNLVTVSVASSDAKIMCTLSASLPATSGSTNTISETCTAPARSGTINHAVVQVT